MTKPISNFVSYAKFLDYVEHTPPTWATNASCDSSPSRAEWFGTETFESALTIARNGWPEGREFLTTVERETVALPNNMTITRASSFDIVGAYPEIGLALSGDPEHMVTIEPIPAPSPILRIGIAGFRTSFVPARTIMQCGGILVSYINALELAGWRCELTTNLDVAENNDKSFHGEVILKQACDTPDQDRILFAIANPSMYRRLFFRVMETFPNIENIFSPGYGCVGCNPVKDFDIFIPPVLKHDTPDTMTDTISKAITNGVPTNDR